MKQSIENINNENVIYPNGDSYNELEFIIAFEIFI